MVSPVGLSAAASGAALRAGVAGFGELPYRDSVGEPVVGATVPGLPLRQPRTHRLLDILTVALQDCLIGVDIPRHQPIPLLVGLAEQGRPGGGAELAGQIVSVLDARLGRRFHPALSRVFSIGHTSTFAALRIARALLEDAAVPACLVCGVDSYVNAPSLLWLERTLRLKTPLNSDGVIPGEAAAAILVQRERPAGARVRIAGLGFGLEKASVLDEDPLLGLGMTEAARAALKEAGLGWHDTHFRLSDVTGESYGFRELALAEARLARVRLEKHPIWHPADSIGDCGAAAGLVLLVMGRRALDHGYAPGPCFLALTAAVPGGRAVAVVRREE
jgi:3-oxoacyl-[acyl-carrier-protein] synthase-1